MLHNNLNFREKLIKFKENNIQYEGINFIEYLVPRTLTFKNTPKTLSDHMELFLEINKNNKTEKTDYHSLYSGKEKQGFAADAAKEDAAIYEKAVKYKLIEKNIKNLDNPDIVVFGELPYYRNKKKVTNKNYL